MDMTNIHLMQKKASIEGQWYGYFSYGPDYGPKLEGEKVIFPLLVEQLNHGQFVGKCIELEGINASSEVSTITGFVDGKNISFRKEYRAYFTIDEQGNEGIYEGSLAPLISYQGTFDTKTQSFQGRWEIWVDEAALGDGTSGYIYTGNWQISRESSSYGI